MGWSGLNVSSWSVLGLRGAWPAKPVGMAQPARPRRRARTLPEPGAGSPKRHGGAWYCNGVASSRSRSWPPAVSRRSRRSGVHLSADLGDPDGADRVRHRRAYETRTSTWRSLDTISSGGCLFWRIVILRLALMSQTSGRTTSTGADQASGDIQGGPQATT